MKRLLTSRERLIGAPVGARELPRTLMVSAFNSAADSRGIMGLAGGLDNRWSRNAGREESPDTSSAQAEKGNAPGNARGRFGGTVYPDCACNCVTDSATENIPPVKRAGDIQQENLRDICFARFAGKGEKVG